MRPIKLIISAFGPYANEQVIDFTKLNSQNIFLITGPTGAGKTTIFDAISYVLFGGASGTDRENDSLRSDFAKDDIETFVEMEFEINNEIYIVKRKPTQMKKKKRGEGYTEQKAEAVLHLPNEDTITKVDAVTSKIEEVMGINKQQFKQIVMLPQGEFKKLLLAESKEKEGIFRKIFGTYDYREIQLKLKNKALELESEAKRSREQVAMNLKGINSEEVITSEYIDHNSIVEKIEEIINKDKEEKKAIESEVAITRDEKLKVNSEIVKGEGNNLLLKQRKELEEKLNNLEELKKDILKKESLLEKIKKALDLKVIEDSLLKKIREKENNIRSLENIKISINNKEKEIEINSNKLKSESLREAEGEKLSNEVHLLKENLKELSKLKDQEEKVILLDNKYKKFNEILSTEKLSKEKLIKDREVKDEFLKEILILEKKLVEIEITIAEKDKLIKLLRDLYKAIDSVNKLKSEHKYLQNEFKLLEEDYNKKKDRYEFLDIAFRKGQAGILSESLIKNMPCPVCGSLEHPSPAEKHRDAPTEEELNNAKREYEKSKDCYDKKLNELTIKNETINLKENDTLEKLIEEVNNYLKEKIQYTNGIEEKIKVLGTTLRDELAEINKSKIDIEGKVAKKLEVEREIKALIIKIEELTEKINKEETEKTAIYGDLQRELEIQKTLKSKLSGDIDSIEELKNVIKDKEKLIEEIKSNIKILKDKELNLQKELSILIGNRDTLLEVNKTLENEANNIEKEFKEKIEVLFIHIDEYNLVKNNTRIDADNIELEINNFKEEYRSAKDRYNELIEKTKGLDVTNIDLLKNNFSTLLDKEKELDKKAKVVYSKIDNNKDRLKSIKSLGDKVLKSEEEYKIIGELADISNGKKAPYITFESFVLASYFENIIRAANVRLKKMTGDRFVLKRKMDKGKGAGQKGLELEVFDNYTGKVRHVKTLSGGESFKASLALALGLSDVIQETAGGIKLDTMFIDEGFGTLDPESLDNAISCLLDLQRGGRLVGIISHVPELKERIEVKLQIETSINGSKAKFIS